LFNAVGLYSELPVVFFYSEFYNLDKFAGDQKLVVEQVVLNSREERKYYKKKMLSRNNNSAVELGAINVKKYPSGRYTLLITAKDSVKQITVYSAKNFYLFNPDVIDTVAELPSDADYLQSEISIMSLEEIDEHFSICEYLRTLPERDEWNKLETLEAKRKFLYDFWKKRDPDAQTPVNELKEEYFERVEYANENFAHLGQKFGWKTDMGRVYISYGSPTDVKRYPNETQSVPYEIWNYTNIEGGVEFIFADFTSYSEYKLIHSTKRGEMANRNWRGEIAR
jgi:GWxTD domain-containing protein